MSNDILKVAKEMIDFNFGATPELVDVMEELPPVDTPVFVVSDGTFEIAVVLENSVDPGSPPCADYDLRDLLTNLKIDEQLIAKLDWDIYGATDLWNSIPVEVKQEVEHKLRYVLVSLDHCYLSGDRDYEDGPEFSLDLLAASDGRNNYLLKSYSRMSPVYWVRNFDLSMLPSAIDAQAAAYLAETLNTEIPTDYAQLIKLVFELYFRRIQ